MSNEAFRLLSRGGVAFAKGKGDETKIFSVRFGVASVGRLTQLYFRKENNGKPNLQ